MFEALLYINISHKMYFAGVRRTEKHLREFVGIRVWNVGFISDMYVDA